LFGYRFADFEPVGESESGHSLLRSAELEELWPHGLARGGELTFESAQYVAKYAVKRVTLSRSSSAEARQKYAERYERVCPRTGEVTEVEPEYMTCSNRPGIARRWITEFLREVYPRDFVVVEGRKSPPPRYYDKVLSDLDPDLYDSVKRTRLLSRDRSDDSDTRLESMERCAVARTFLHGSRE
jgi:hypothetical protein